MRDQPLIPRGEYLLGEGAALALWGGLLLRLLWNYLVEHQLDLMHAQLFWGLTLLALLYAWGSLAPRAWALPGFTVLGSLAWLAAVTMAAAVTWLPALRDLWWQVPWLAQPYALWLRIAAGALVVTGVVLRLRAARRAGIIALSRGYERTLDWAAGRPFYSRLTIKRFMTGRGVDC